MLINCETENVVNENSQLSEEEQTLLNTITSDPYFDILSINLLRIQYYSYKTGLTYEEISNFSNNTGNIASYSSKILKAEVNKSDIVYDMRMFKQLTYDLTKKYPLDCDAKELRLELNKLLVDKSFHFLKKQTESYLAHKNNGDITKKTDYKPCEENKDCPRGQLCCRAFAEVKSVCVEPVLNDRNEPICPVFSLPLDEVVINNSSNNYSHFSLIPSWFYTGTLNTTEQYPYYDQNNNNNQWFGNGGSFGPPIPNTVDDDQIDSDELADKEKCLNEHLDKKGNSFIKNIFNKFKGNSKFDIKIISKDRVFSTEVTTGDGVNGITRHTPGSSLINIEISTSKLANMPALAAARTLIHEYIHADMYRKINSPNYDGDLDFKTTYEKFENGNFQASAQHETMAELYVHSMRDALKDFHKNVLKNDYNYLTNNGENPIPDSFYEALAWQGLKDHNVKAYADLSTPEKTELSDALEAHYHSTTKNCPQ